MALPTYRYYALVEITDTLAETYRVRCHGKYQALTPEQLKNVRRKNRKMASNPPQPSPGDFVAIDGPSGRKELWVSHVLPVPGTDGFDMVGTIR